MKSTTVRALIVLLFVTLSCSDKDAQNLSPTGLLQFKSWKTQSYSFKPDYPNASSTDSGLDDVISFYDNGLITYDDGNNRDADDPQLSFGSWSINTGQTEITFSLGTQTTPSVRQIVSIDNSKLVYKHSFQEGGVTYEITKEHKAIEKVTLQSQGFCSLSFQGISYSTYDDNQGSCNGDKVLEMIEWRTDGQVLFGIDLKTSTPAVTLILPSTGTWGASGAEVSSKVKIQSNGEIAITGLQMESIVSPGTKSSLNGKCKCVSGGF